MDQDDIPLKLEELRAELAALRRLFGMGQVPTFTLDAGGVVVATNGEWFGGHPPDCVGSPLWDLFDAECQPALERYAAAGWVGVSALHLQLTDGRDVALSAAALSQEQWMVAIRDIRRRVMLEDAIELRRQLSLLADFAGTVARELIDPMSIVQGRLELGVVAEPESRNLEVALDHARRLSASLRNLRLVGRSPVPVLAQVPVSDVVDDALELVGPRRGQVHVELEPEALAAGGDPSMYARVVASLLRASLEGAGRSSVLVRAKAAREGTTVEVGPVGRPRGKPDASRTGLALESTLLRSLGGELWAWRRGNDRHFEARLPPPPVTPKSKRPSGASFAPGGLNRVSRRGPARARHGRVRVPLRDRSA